MYYNEKWIDGELFYQHTPNGSWIKFTTKMYIERVIERELEILSLYKEIEDLKNKLNNIED